LESCTLNDFNGLQNNAAGQMASICINHIGSLTEQVYNPKERFYPAIFVQDTGMAYQILRVYQEKHANASAK
jgi:hypothetical protein